jgi:hypothetical protein
MAKMTLEALTEQLRGAYGAALRAVVLYGSAAAGELIPKRSGLDVLVLVDSLDASQLNAASAVARAWAADGHPAPLIFTMREWRGSVDIFPMEYADILDRHRVLYGELPLDGIQVHQKELRWQLENQAMGKLLHLRQGVLATGGDKRLQLELLEQTLSTYMVLFRAALRLTNETPSTDYEALSRKVGSHAGFDPEPFVRVVRHVRGAQKLPAAEVPQVLQGYLEGATRFTAYVDQFYRAAEAR